MSESYFGILSFVRIVFWNIVICPNPILEYCHLSESYFGILSFVRILFWNIVICRILFLNIVICPNPILEYCHLSESYFGILSFVRILFWKIVICPNSVLSFIYSRTSEIRTVPSEQCPDLRISFSITCKTGQAYKISTL